MPRQLPWLNKDRTTKTSSSSIKPAKHPRSGEEDADEDFFAGTLLASSRKSNRSAGVDVSDEELPILPTEPTRKRRDHSALHLLNDQLPSSSPPPADAELPPPRIELMRKGTSKFDLRDDEYMMVEDEFLQTAKLFTRHLHLAEYERMKENLQEKQRTPRPVVPSMKPSVEGRMHMKAQAQEKAQKQALKCSLASATGDSSGDDLDELDDVSSYKDISTPIFQPTRSGPALSTNTRSFLPTSRQQPREARQEKVSPHAEQVRKQEPKVFAKPGLPRGVQNSSQTSTVPAPTLPSKRPPPRPLSLSKESEPPIKTSQSSRFRSTSMKPERRSAFELLDDFDLAKVPPAQREVKKGAVSPKKTMGPPKDKAKNNDKPQDDIPTFMF